MKFYHKIRIYFCAYALHMLLFIFGMLLAICLPAYSVQKIKLVLDWLPNPNHAPIFVAKERGFFERNGVEVEIITPADPGDPPKWVALGRANLALDYQIQTLLQKERGLPIKQVGTLINQPLNCLVVLGSDNIRQLRDLCGKKIAYSAPEVDLLMLKTMLKNVGLSLQDVEPINVHYDLAKALITKKVSAAIGLMRNIEVPEIQSLGMQTFIFLPEKYGVPHYSELIFIAASKASLSEFKTFFQALNDAGQYLQTHPKECWQIFAKNHPELSSPLYEKEWFATLPKFATLFQSIDTIQIQNLQNFLKQRRFLSNS